MPGIRRPAIVALLIAVFVLAGSAHAQTFPTTSQIVAAPVGCPPPANIPAVVLNNPHFQAELFRFSQRTYPLCKVQPGAYAQALSQALQTPSSFQFSGTAEVVTNTNLPDGTGETPWSTIGPVGIDSGYAGTVSGHVEALVTDPTNSLVMYAGTESGGVWKTIDGGAHWTPPAVTETTPNIGALAIDPTNHNVLYAGTGYGIYEINGNGLLKSIDGGTTWSALGTSSTFGFFTGFRKIVVDPVTPSVVWAATSGGLYRSSDSGASWTSMSTGTDGLPNDTTWDLALSPSNHNIVYVTVGKNFGSSTDAGIYQSTNGGSTWTLLGNGPNGNTSTAGGNVHVGLIRLAFGGPSSAPILYATVENPTNSTLFGAYKSTNGGSTWTQIGNPDPPSSSTAGTQWWYDDALITDPHDTTGKTIWVGGINIFKSTDGGATWSDITDVYGTNPKHVHPDQHVFDFAGSTLYVGNDGGMYSTSDGGSTWPDHNATLDATEFYSAATDTAYAPRVIGGSQDNGTEVWGASTSNLRWTEIFGGDGGDTAIDYTAPQTYYEEYVNLDLHKSTNAGGTWTSISSGISDRNRACFIAPFQMDASNPQHLIAGTAEVYQTTNGGTSWSAISSDLTVGNGCVTALALAPSSPTKTMYASTSGGKVWVTQNGGSSWQDISTGLPNFWKSALVVDPKNPQIAYIGGGYCVSSGCIWRTTNAGASWQNISGNLGNYNVNTVVVDPLDSSHLYIGTDLGAFETSNLGGTWTRLNTGMPLAEIDQLNLNRSGTILTAGTYGRGMYQLFRTWEALGSAAGTAGTPLAVYGHGFAAGEQVTTTFNGTALNTTAADASGNVSATIVIPNLSTGTYPVRMTGGTSSRTGSRSYAITLAATSPLAGNWVNANYNTTDIAQVLMAPNGTALAVHPYHACSGSLCDWGSVNGPVYGNSTSSTTPNAFTANFTFSYGPVIMTGSLAGSNLQIQTFTQYTDGSGRSNVYTTDLLRKTGVIGTTTLSGAPGSVMTIGGRGYRPNETVTLLWNCSASSCASPTSLGSVTTNSLGDFSTSVTVPAGTNGTAYSIRASGASSGFVNYALFTVT